MLEEREARPIIHLKKLNNWIKSVLIQLYARRGDAVLDLACGKGRDLIKWDKAKIGYYVGIDIAEGSVVMTLDCRGNHVLGGLYNKQDGIFYFVLTSFGTSTCYSFIIVQ
ncbi:mRNA cap guanine-N7 methyltransferase 1-like [Prunus avium]|uniref:mRNA (guanine-N(7))-methyltransferase n=1 Tax=Prunus avium TaxID=42229 RepID=A0A6P5R4M7_PRUAV|nr:mRNA cap guanine-N7 methyltransferase 1-like [Prunus avium]